MSASEVMRCESVMRRYCWAAAPLYCLLLLAGCSDSNQRSSDAAALPTVARDPVEEAPASENWPAWRGVNSCGVSADRGLPIEWTTEQGIRWKQTVPGRGNSSPVVWGERVLITSDLGETDANRLVIFAYDRRSGKLVWQADAGQAGGATHNKNGYASASVATDGRLVYASFGSAGLVALDFESGEQRWRADLGKLEHEWGSASSPIIVGERVIQLCDCATDSSLKAFGKSDGHLLWSTARPSSGCWSTPVLIAAAGADGQKQQQLVVNGTGVDGAGRGSVIAYDPQSGRELWRVEGTTEVVCPTPIVGGGLVISTSGRNGPVMAIQPGAGGDAAASKVVWKHARGGAYVPTGLAYRNRLYTLADGGIISCFNLGDGEEIWHERLRGNFTSSLVAGDGRIYAVNESGAVYVMAAGDTFQSLATNDMQERVLATPAIAGGDIFLRTETQLYCVAGSAEAATARQDSGDKSIH